jgi:hypothetical protein
MKTAQQIHARLTEMEKIDLRRASPDRLHYLAHTIYQIEASRDVSIMEKVQQMCVQDFREFAATNTGRYIGKSWKF